MHSVVFVVAVLVAAISGATGQDECGPPPPGSPKRTPPSVCCNLQSFATAGIMAASKKCWEKNTRPPKPTGPPPSGEMPKEMKEHHACKAQCIFGESGLLNSDNKTVNEDAVRKAFTSSNSDLQPVVDAALTKCLGTYKSNIDQTLNCTSGAAELEKCTLRETFINCPSSLWTSSTDCDNLKARVIKCPNLPIKFFGGGKHHH